jgi:hypothetical protein
MASALSRVGIAVDTGVGVAVCSIMGVIVETGTVAGDGVAVRTGDGCGSGVVTGADGEPAISSHPATRMHAVRRRRRISALDIGKLR